MAGDAPGTSGNHHAHVMICPHERQKQLHAIASDLLYWKGGLKVLRQAQLPKWRGHFKWQIEAKIEALQAEYATLRAESANEGG